MYLLYLPSLGVRKIIVQAGNSPRILGRITPRCLERQADDSKVGQDGSARGTVAVLLCLYGSSYSMHDDTAYSTGENRCESKDVDMVGAASRRGGKRRVDTAQRHRRSLAHQKRSKLMGAYGRRCRAYIEPKLDGRLYADI